jgi:photosystem II stability/assembly factor-like uncharacterized protein
MKIRIILIFLIALISEFTSAQWQQITIPMGFDIFNSSFPSNQTGYVCGYGNRFHRTTNGGLNWQDLSFQGTAENLNAVWFVTNRTGFLASTNDTVYKTSNGGESWYYNYKMPFPVSNLQFLDSLTGYAFAYNKMAVTTNSGENWTVRNIASSGNFFFLNSQTGWNINYLGGGNSQLYKTTDGGLNWLLQYSTADFKILYDVFFVNQNTGWVSGYRHYIAKTTDGGQNWIVQNEAAGAPGLYSIYFVNPNTGWTAGDNYSSTSCYYTTNGGTNWQRENGVVHSGRITRIRFSSPYNGWICGQYGKVFKTDNSGGLTGISNSLGTALKFSLIQNYPNPFNPSTNIKYQISNNSFVTLKVYDIRGKEIATLVNEKKSSGYYESEFKAENIPSGVYFYTLRTDDFTDTKKMILIK